MKLLRIAFALSMFLLIGCAGARIQEALQSWIGAPEDRLIERFGVPDKKMNLSDGSKVYEYNQCHRGNTVPVQNTFTHQTMYYQNNDFCDAWIFKIADGVIVSDRFQRK